MQLTSDVNALKQDIPESQHVKVEDAIKSGSDGGTEKPADSSTGDAGGGAGTGTGGSGAGDAGAGAGTGTAGAGADSGAGGGTSNTPTAAEIEADKKAEEKLLAKLGVSSLQELESKIKPPVIETEEEKVRKAETYRATLNQYAVTEGKMTNADIQALENLKAAKPEDIVFGDFNTKYLAKNPDAKPEDVQAAYKIFYNVDSENEFLKEAGQQSIAERANAIKAEAEKRFNEVKSEFDSLSERKQRVPEFRTALKSVISSTLPNEFILEGEGDDSIKFIVKDAERAEIEKALVTDDNFDLFLGSKNPQQVAEDLKKRAIDMLYLRNKDAIFKTIKDAAHAKGLKAGSATGASAPFGLNGGTGTGQSGNSDTITVEDDNKLKRAKGLM